MSKNKNDLKGNNASNRDNLPDDKEFPQLPSSTIRQMIGRLKDNWLTVVVVICVSIGALGAGLKYLEDSAKAEVARQKQNPHAKQDESFLARVNPFMPAPMPLPTPQHSKDYVYAGKKIVAAEDHDANAIPPNDLAVWRPSDGYWYCMGGPGSQTFTVAWGTNGDVPVQGDYDADGKTDLAIFRPTTGIWWIYPSGGAPYYTVSLGASCTPPNGCDVTLAADYDADGKTDPAIFRPSTNYWYVKQSSTGNTVSTQFGTSGDVPVPADYDGDGKADIAVWRSSSATFYVVSSINGNWLTQTIGYSGDTPVPGDYDGDGKADFALRHSDDWVIKQSSSGSTNTLTWQSGSYTAVQNDYDGDGKCDVAVWKPSGKGAGTWYIRNSHDSSTRTESWGSSGDIPVPALFRR